MPIAAAARLMAVLASVLTQQHLTVAVSDPRVQVAEHAVARLDSGTDARSIVPAKTVGIASSSDPYLVVFDRARRVTASSAALHGRMGQVIMGWLGSLSATALATVLFGVFGPRTRRRGKPAAEPDTAPPDPGVRIGDPRAPDRRRHHRQLLSPPGGGSNPAGQQRSSRSADRRCCTQQDGRQGSAARRRGTTWRR